MDITTQIYMQIILKSGNLLQGESRAGGYENRIDIESFSFHAGAKDQPVRAANPMELKSSIDFDPIKIVKVFDRSSLLLAGVLNRKERFEEVKIAVDQQFIDVDWDGKVRNEILIFRLYRGYVANLNLRTTEGDKGASIKEDVTLSFEQFGIDYWAEDRDYNIGRLVGDYRYDYYGYESSKRDQEAG